MIQYALKCRNGHCFDSWFQSAEAFDKLAAAGMVTCAVCGSTHVEKAIMTPSVRPARDAGAKPAPQKDEVAAPLSEPASEAERFLTRLRREIEAKSDYVGTDFATEARRIHLGEAPERAIYGEAGADEARALVDDGIPVAPLPFMPNRKTN